MIGKKEIETLENRAASARITLAELCELSGLSYTTWWRWKKKGEATVRGFRKLENELDRLEDA